MKKRTLFILISIGFGLLISLSLGEGLFRILEARSHAQSEYEGKGGLWVQDERWGWKPGQGYYRIKTDEFSVEGEVNSLNMNDEPYTPTADADVTRIFVLGDSHTYATGVSMEQTWAKVLQGRLNSASGGKRFRVYNGGVTGFNLHQYLLRLLDQGSVLHPHYVVMGLSYATDLYDLLPPDRGGWIYGGNRARDYFDFDSAGTLQERHWTPVKSTSAAQEQRQSHTVQSVRTLLDQFATFRYLRRSNLSLWLGSHITIGGKTLWPNMEVVVEKQVTAEHEYQWKLFEALLLRIKQESERQHAELIVLGIPYLAQVYDDIWELSFGKDSRFSRTAAIERVQSFCRTHGILYVDTLDALRSKTKQVGHWLHYRKDAHPTAEGQEVIADTLYRAGLIHVRN